MLTIGRAVGDQMGVLRYLFSFRGRINRAKLWLWSLISFILGIPQMLIDPESEIGRSTPVLAHYQALGASAQDLVMAGVLAFNLLLLWPTLALQVKRLHDCDKSGWWMLFFFGVPVLCVAVSMTALGIEGAEQVRTAGLPWLSFAAMIAAGIIGLWGFVQLYCTPGTEGDNRFGWDPLVGPPYCTPENPVKGCIPNPAA